MQNLGLWTAALAILVVRAMPAQDLVADTVLINGKVITVDSTDSVAEAMAIRDGKMIEVGAKELVMRHVGEKTRVIDLHGRTATPGLIDAHLHFASVDPIYSIDLSTVHSMQQVQQGVRERVDEAHCGRK